MLRLNGNKLETKEHKGGMSFAQALQINATLQHLDLGDTDLVSLLIPSSKPCTMLFYTFYTQALQINATLQHLDLGDTDLVSFCMPSSQPCIIVLHNLH